MASNISLQARKVPDFTQSCTVPTTLLERIEQLVESYESGQISPLNISVQVDPLIKELFNLKEKNLSLARKGLCQLLKVNVEKVQLEVMRHLKPLFRLSILDDDVKNNQTKQLVDLEKQISDVLALYVRSSSSEVLFGLIDLYQDILERLWLLPLLVENRDSYVIIEGNIQRMMRDADRWLTPLLSDNTQPEELKMALENLPRMFQQIRSCPPAIIDEIKLLKSIYIIFIFPAAVGDICHKVGDNRRAIVHYFESLVLIAFLRYQNPNPNLKISLEIATHFVLNAIGIAHHSLGEYHKSIEYLEKILQIAQALGDRGGEGKAYGDLGIAYRSLGEYPKAIECHEKHLQIAQALGDRGGEGAAYANLGNAYRSLGDYRKAIVCHEKHLQLAQTLGDRGGEGKAYGGLGIAYQSLGEYPKAIEYHEKHLRIAQAVGDRGAEGVAYGGLGNVYQALGKYRKAIEYHEKHLQMVQALGDRGGEGRAYGNLGIAYDSLGDYRKTIGFFENDLRIAQELGDRGGEGAAYGNLGSVYRSLGDYRKSIEFYEKALKIAQALGDRGGEEGAYGSLGNAYRSLREYHKAVEYHEKALKIAQELSDREGEGAAYTNLGNVYDSLGDYRKAIEACEQALQIALELGDRGGEGAAYANLGNVYHSLGEYRKAIECHEKHLKIAQELGDRWGEGTAFNNLGCTHEYLNELPQAEQYFRRSIAIYSSLQHELGDSHQWKITIFEEQVNAYLGLERILLKQNKLREALEVSNARRARSLYGVLTKRKNLQLQQVDTLMNIDAILNFVTTIKSTCLLYSFCAPSREEKAQLSIYVITPSGEIHFKELASLDLLPEDSREVSKIVSRFPFGRTKGEEVPPSAVPIIAEMEECFATKGKDDPIPPVAIRKFKERLKKWYEVFIKPIEQYLPQEKSSPLVIIPDGFLSQLPFAAFLGEREGKDQYLIERFSLSFAPSLSTLSLLSSSSVASSRQACIVCNPATPDSNLSLEESENHVPKLNSLLKAPAEALFISKKATVESFKQVVSRARLIHIACHGEAGTEKNPDKFSVFEGLLKFAPDDFHKDGYLHAQEIASFPLIADLVFLDACFSGAGKVQREGSIGPIWSFHAAGASSVIGGLWFIPESKLIVDLIDNFYTYYLSQSMSRSKALHLAMTKAIEQERESPHLWGPLFLSGAN